MSVCSYKPLSSISPAEIDKRFREIYKQVCFLSSSGGGTITSVSGTTNRITSTGGTTPVIDISATFEALLLKSANNLSDLTDAATARTNLGVDATLTFSNGLTRTVDNVTNNLITGFAGSQNIIGGIAASETLTLSSTSHATKGKILFGNSTYDEVNNYLGIGIVSPLYTLHMVRTVTGVTNNMQSSVKFASVTDADMVDGFGTAILFAIQDNAAVDNNLARFGAQRSGADNSGKLVFGVYNAGTAQNYMTLSPAGNLYVGTHTANSNIGSAKLHLVSTTEQIRSAYDGSNYLSVTTASNGSTTFALTGTTPLYTFSQGITISNGNLTLGTAGNKITITEGTNGRSGSATLINGTLTITITGITTSSRAFVQLTITGGTLGNNYKAVCTTDTLTITSVVTAGTIQALDTSTLNYFIIN